MKGGKYAIDHFIHFSTFQLVEREREMWEERSCVFFDLQCLLFEHSSFFRTSVFMSDDWSVWGMFQSDIFKFHVIMNKC